MFSTDFAFQNGEFACIFRKWRGCAECCGGGTPSSHRHEERLLRVARNR
jgi:hypothetical protein